MRRTVAIIELPEWMRELPVEQQERMEQEIEAELDLKRVIVLPYGVRLTIREWEYGDTTGA